MHVDDAKSQKRNLSLKSACKWDFFHLLMWMTVQLCGKHCHLVASGVLTLPLHCRNYSA